jgi:hypothetical protein
MRPYTRELEIIIGDTEFSVLCQHKKNKFSHSVYTGRSCSFFFYLCCSNGSPDGRDVQAGLTDRIICQRHVGGFLVFSYPIVLITSKRYVIESVR